MFNWTTIVAFILGLIGSLFIQWWTDKKRLRRIKGALKLHLQEIILKECHTLRLEFSRVIGTVESLTTPPMGFKSCKTFDAEIYKTNNPSDYYQIYRYDKFAKLVSIYAIITFLKDNLPSKVYSNYKEEFNRNYYIPVNEGRSANQMVQQSPVFNMLRSETIALCNSLILEIDTLTKLIKEFI